MLNYRTPYSCSDPASAATISPRPADHRSHHHHHHHHHSNLHRQFREPGPLDASSTPGARFERRDLAISPCSPSALVSKMSQLLKSGPSSTGAASPICPSSSSSSSATISKPRQPSSSSSSSSQMTIHDDPLLARSITASVVASSSARSTVICTATDFALRPARTTGSGERGPDGKLRFWCPTRPGRAAMGAAVNKRAAHRHTPPPHLLQNVSSFMDDEDEDEDDDYSEDEYSDDDDDDAFDTDVALASRVSCGSSGAAGPTNDDDDDCIFSSD